MKKSEPCELCNRDFPAADLYRYDTVNGEERFCCKPCMDKWEQEQKKISGLTMEVVCAVYELEQGDPFNPNALVLRLFYSHLSHGYPSRDEVMAFADKIGLDEIAAPALYKLLQRES